MRTAVLASKRRGAPTNRVAVLAAPAGGWNARDALDGMGETDAVTLENWLVVPGGIRTRRGFTRWATGLGAPVESLMEYAPQSGNRRLFAAAGSSLFDVTASGPVGAPAVTGLGSSRWQHRLFAIPGGTYLAAVDGISAPRSFDGTTWSETPFTATGLVLNNLVNVHSHMNRLWFIERSTANAWYAPLQSYTGALVKFPLGPLLVLGGELVAMGSWTHDGGDGADDYAVFLSNQGEALVYQGTDPATASTFSLVGRYYLPKPLGRRCMLRTGGELLILTEAGILPLSQAQTVGPEGGVNVAITAKIGAAYLAAVAAAGDAFGWQAIAHPAGAILLVNVPVRERASQDQFALGTQTAGWSRLTGLDAGCWSQFGAGLFFGGNDGSVGRYGSDDDDGAPILASFQSAFTALRSAANKRVTLARPRTIGPPGFSPTIHVKANFDTAPTAFHVVHADGLSTPWGAPWGSPWGLSAQADQDWQGVEGTGVTLSIASRISTMSEVTWNGTDLALEAGAYL